MEYKDINWEDLNIHQDIIQLPDEVWKDMSGIQGDRFEISNYGRCRRKPYESFHGLKDYSVMKISDNGAGYKKFALTYNYKLKNLYVHRMVATYFIPNPDNLPQVNHKPTGLGKFDNRVEHLEWCTESYNINDAHNNGQMDNRTKHNTSVDRKSDEFIAEMYLHYKRTGLVGETARLFGVPRTTLSSIVNKRSRRKITDKIDQQTH